ncbi:MAG: hypothetical protein MJY79_05625 [Bacteroidaceae bacterium]|nr:hypothetical protein [Bacteroidaceae bacterium]
MNTIRIKTIITLTAFAALLGCEDPTDDLGTPGNDTPMTPEAVTENPTKVGRYSSVLVGTVVPPRNKAEHFQYGFDLSTDSVFDSSDIRLTVSTECDSVTTFYFEINDLIPKTTYYYRSYMLNESDCYTGETKMFTTEGFTVLANGEQTEDNLATLILNNENISLFSQAMMMTRMIDSLCYYEDPAYISPSYDSITWSSNGSTGIIYDTGYEHECGIFPEKRLFKYTVFAEKDSLYHAYGIHNIDDLIEYAKAVYDEAYPEDKGRYDSDYTDRRNPLNRFVSYHILPEELEYSKLTHSSESILNNYGGWKYQDVENFYETMMPHSLMRLSYPKTGGRYINRRGFVEDYTGINVRGVRIFAPSEYTEQNQSINGVCHYIDDMLTYSKETREIALNVRMRKFVNTFSPDFINSGAWGRLYDFNNPETRYTMSYKSGFAKNVRASSDTQYWVRYVTNSFSSFFGDEMTIRGDYDIEFRLPPVPYDGQYEIRMFMNTLAGTGVCDRGSALVYFREGSDSQGHLCREPLDFTMDRTDNRVGGASTTDMTEAEIFQLNKSMRSHGYMLPMDSYSDLSNKLLNRSDCYRIILTTEEMSANSEYWIRFKNAEPRNSERLLPLNTIEIVPVGVLYDEDLH